MVNATVKYDDDWLSNGRPLFTGAVDSLLPAEKNNNSFTLQSINHFYNAVYCENSFFSISLNFFPVFISMDGFVLNFINKWNGCWFCSMENISMEWIVWNTKLTLRLDSYMLLANCHAKYLAAFGDAAAASAASRYALSSRTFKTWMFH